MASHVRGAVPEKPCPAPDLIPGEDAWHTAKRNAMHDMVLARLETNHNKEGVYLANPNFNRLHATSEAPRKSRSKSHTLHGGVFTTKMGQAWGLQRLKERIAEYNLRASAAFGVEAQQAPPTAPPGKNEDEMHIETAFNALFDAVQAVEFTNMVPAANRILSLLYSVGSKVDINQAILYLRYTIDIKTDLLAALEQPPEILGDPDMNMSAWAAGKKRVIKTVLPVMDRIARLLNLIVKTGNLGVDSRKLAITSSRGRDVVEAKSQYDNSPNFASPSRYYTGKYKMDKIMGEETTELNPELPPAGAQRDIPGRGQERPPAREADILVNQMAGLNPETGSTASPEGSESGSVSGSEGSGRYRRHRRHYKDSKKSHQKKKYP